MAKTELLHGALSALVTDAKTALAEHPDAHPDRILPLRNIDWDKWAARFLEPVEDEPLLQRDLRLWKAVQEWLDLQEGHIPPLNSIEGHIHAVMVHFMTSGLIGRHNVLVDYRDMAPARIDYFLDIAARYFDSPSPWDLMVQEAAARCFAFGFAHKSLEQFSLEKASSYKHYLSAALDAAHERAERQLKQDRARDPNRDKNHRQAIDTRLAQLAALVIQLEERKNASMRERLQREIEDDPVYFNEGWLYSMPHQDCLRHLGAMLCAVIATRPAVEDGDLLMRIGGKFHTPFADYAVAVDAWTRHLVEGKLSSPVLEDVFLNGLLDNNFNRRTHSIHMQRIMRGQYVITPTVSRHFVDAICNVNALDPSLVTPDIVAGCIDSKPLLYLLAEKLITLGMSKFKDTDITLSDGQRFLDYIGLSIYNALERVTKQQRNAANGKNPPPKHEMEFLQSVHQSCARLWRFLMIGTEYGQASNIEAVHDAADNFNLPPENLLAAYCIHSDKWDDAALARVLGLIKACDGLPKTAQIQETVQIACAVLQLKHPDLLIERPADDGHVSVSFSPAALSLLSDHSRVCR